MQSNFTVTPAALNFMRRMVRFSGTPTGGFRLTVAPGGCSGYSAEFSVEAAPRPGDAEQAVEGLRLFLPAESRMLLDGVTVDHVDTPLQSGFTFANVKGGAYGCSSSGEAPTPPAEASVALSSIKRK
ncbi:HesB/IscA family protein [Azohydromonas caseinilytica]|uniref:IscN protein n=1 Tax=Azohydromonas caseinilytica TaxID=2728836 RepID=A0A848F9E8_9BURK|nr:iron-sulfur cluster biosynthesis family protein [Azohydromonas caseinilytica]NML16164.1 IscN protein [Azohydromonas caseinilytica]